MFVTSLSGTRSVGEKRRSTPVERSMRNPDPHAAAGADAAHAADAYAAQLAGRRRTTAGVAAVGGGHAARAFLLRAIVRIGVHVVVRSFRKHGAGAHAGALSGISIATRCERTVVIAHASGKRRPRREQQDDEGIAKDRHRAPSLSFTAENAPRNSA